MQKEIYRKLKKTFSFLEIVSVSILQRDDEYKMRMTAIHSYLLDNVSFKSTGKHATSFCKLMFTANLRSLFCWRREDINNKRKGMDYGFLMSLPDVVRTWVCEERARHLPYYAMHGSKKRRRDKGERKIKTVQWLKRFKKLFTLATGEAFKKQQMVRLLLHSYTCLLAY